MTTQQSQEIEKQIITLFSAFTWEDINERLDSIFNNALNDGGLHADESEYFHLIRLLKWYTKASEPVYTDYQAAMEKKYIRADKRRKRKRSK